MYDPLGFLDPVAFPAKHLLHELCRLNVSWDEGIGKVEHAHLKPFCNASEVGYGIVTYMRLVNSQEQVHVKFVMGKSRVAPLKLMAIPRRELTAAVLAVRMNRMLVAKLKLDLEPSVFWTDSATVLKYIRSDSRRFHTFVANRVNAIQGMSDASQWEHIPGKLNPADSASQGLNAADFLKGSNWTNGPMFVKDLPN